jgi:hypothetical protein
MGGVGENGVHVPDVGNIVPEPEGLQERTGKRLVFEFRHIYIDVMSLPAVGAWRTSLVPTNLFFDPVA